MGTDDPPLSLHCPDVPYEGLINVRKFCARVTLINDPVDLILVICCSALISCNKVDEKAKI